MKPMKRNFRDYLAVGGYAALLAMLVGPMVVLRDYPWWFLLGLAIAVVSVSYDAARSYRRRFRRKRDV
jgi:hypothetical protein